MTRIVSVVHRTHYRYDRAVWLSPHEIRLRPAPHARNPIRRYELHVAGAERVHWFHDAYGNPTARVVFGKAVTELEIEVMLAVDVSPLNPFGFLVADHAQAFPFAYVPAERTALEPYLHAERMGPRMTQWQAALRAQLGERPISSIEALVALNRIAAAEIGYVRRMEPGVQSCESTLEQASGSCRDSGWLVAQALRHFGVASRFVSGYLFQTPRTSGAESPRLVVDLHAWCEAYLPGAGWIGLDPTSGLLAAELHVPLACGAEPGATAPVQGLVGAARADLSVTMDARELEAPGN